MQVNLIAYTKFNKDAFEYATGFRSEAFSDADGLAEAAGRACYQAWERKNPATADTMGYLANIIDHQHFSVLEHSSATFYITDVSRSLLAELTRHRHLSFSVESQRYVDQADREAVIPPALRGLAATSLLVFAHQEAVHNYRMVRDSLEESGVPRKQAREAARAFLLNSQPVSMVVTGNMRAWREVLTKRYHMAADAEIRELARELLIWLRATAPGSFQDFDLDNPIGNEEVRRAAA
ncbi:FAD-dependent thymidylate synthase [Nonomuraea sp. ZG12]|uniref:FAD-dependent thymidylate synthase n=1 Tax=Nonomuraea sp. ZG12 TaxID=3452207 RepID=UPI003F892A1A